MHSDTFNVSRNIVTSLDTIAASTTLLKAYNVTITPNEFHNCESNEVEILG